TPEFKVDIVLMSLVFLHIPDTQKILQALFNALNNGGKLIIVDFDKNNNVNHPKIHNGFSHDEMKNRLSELGYKSNEIKHFIMGSVFLRNKMHQCLYPVVLNDISQPNHYVEIRSKN